MDHSHCDSCILTSCKKREDSTCQMEVCLNGCGVSLHRCKVPEHAESTCPESRVPCINAQHGCEALLRRKHMGSHLEHCPASTIVCKFSRDRMTTYTSRAKADIHTTSDGPDSAPSRLLDGQFLQGDLELAQSEHAVRCSGEFCYGDLDYGISEVENFRERMPSDPNRPLNDSDVSIHCTLGVLTQMTAATSSQCNTAILRPREKLCLKMPVQFRHHATKRCSGTKPQSRVCYAFPCNEITRRDEFSTHWKCLHLNVELDMCRIVERCPMHSYGCMYGETRLVPNPPGSSIEYHHTYNHFLLTSPYLLSEAPARLEQDESDHNLRNQDSEFLEGRTSGFIELERLPAEVLVAICEFLDSMSLWNLSQTSCHIREVCLNIVRRKGIVYHRWYRDEATSRWTLGPKVWSFSRVFHEIRSWSYLNTPAIGSHMMLCDQLRANAISYDGCEGRKLLDPTGEKVKRNKKPVPRYISPYIWY